MNSILVRFLNWLQRISRCSDDIPDYSIKQIRNKSSRRRSRSSTRTGFIGGRTEILTRQFGEPLAWLIVTIGSNMGQEYALHKDEAYIIGRSSFASDIALEDDFVSGQHAKIRFENGRFIIFDLASSNGTLVNGQQIMRHGLVAGDIVQIGQTRLLFKTSITNDERENWYEVISDRLWSQGYAMADELEGLPRQYRDGLLQDYQDEHSELNLEYDPQCSALAFRNHHAIESLSLAWRKFLASEEETEKLEQVDTITAIVSKALGGESYDRPVVSADGRLWSSWLDATLAFEGLNAISRIPLLFFDSSKPTLEDFTTARHLLARDSRGASNIFLFLFPATEEEIRMKQSLLEEKLGRPFALDGIAIEMNQLKQVVAARKPNLTLRQLVLPNVQVQTLSPFVVQAPVSDTVFVGRETEMRQISQNASTTSNAIIGGRRIGKTSVLLRLYRDRLPNLGYRTLWHDCSSTPTYEVFLNTSLRNWEPDSPQTEFSSFGELLESPPDDKPLVLLLDEADKLIPVDRDSGWTLFNALRAFANLGQGQIVLSGERTLQEALRDPKSPLFNFTNEILLGPLDYRAVEELVTRPMKQLEIELVEEKAIVDRIWAFTSGHPNVVQRLCRRLIERLNEMGVRHITMADVNTVIEEPSFQRDDFLSTYWEAATPLEKIISLLMSDNDEVRTLQSLLEALEDHCGLQPSAREIDDALQRLVNLRSILKRTPTGYEFAVKAFPRVVAGTMTLNDMLMILTEEYEEHSE